MDWKLGFGFIWIDVSELTGLSRIHFWPFFIKQNTKRFSNWFGMAWNISDSLRMYMNQVFSPNQSNLKSIQTEFSIRINPNNSNLRFIQIDSDWKFDLYQSELGLNRINLDWKLGSRLVRMHSDWCLGINQITSDWFLTVFQQTK